MRKFIERKKERRKESIYETIYRKKGYIKKK